MKKLLNLCLVMGAATCFIQQAHAQLVIANPSVKISEASKSDLKDVFTGGSSTLGGAHVAPVLLKGGPTSDEFLAEYIGKGDSAFRASWRSLVFSGQATMPKSFATDAEVVEYVAHTPGAVGYVSKSAPHEGVKVLAIH
jgi:ABC-type phosphate transport system substrate-binding protein